MTCSADNTVRVWDLGALDGKSAGERDSHTGRSVAYGEAGSRRVLQFSGGFLLGGERFGAGGRFVRCCLCFWCSHLVVDNDIAHGNKYPSSDLNVPRLAKKDSVRQV